MMIQQVRPNALQLGTQFGPLPFPRQPEGVVHPQPMTTQFIGVAAEGYADVLKGGMKMKFNLWSV
jgi:hypothetical protein